MIRKGNKIRDILGVSVLSQKMPLTQNTFSLKMYYTLPFMAQGLGYLVSFV